MDTLVLVDKQKFSLIYSVLSMDSVDRTYKVRWFIGTDGENEFLKNLFLSPCDDEEKFYEHFFLFSLGFLWFKMPAIHTLRSITRTFFTFSVKPFVV